jgi:addiction module HigA family antidote
MSVMVERAEEAEEELIELTHPGEVLKEEFLTPMNITPYRLAKEIGVQQTRISEILNGKRDISPQTSVLLDAYFGLSNGFWLRLQADYDARKARRAMREQLQKLVA